jgi:hypothetical protein
LSRRPRTSDANRALASLPDERTDCRACAACASKEVRQNLSRGQEYFADIDLPQGLSIGDEHVFIALFFIIVGLQIAFEALGVGLGAK